MFPPQFPSAQITQQESSASTGPLPSRPTIPPSKNVRNYSAHAFPTLKAAATTKAALPNAQSTRQQPGSSPTDQQSATTLKRRTPPPPNSPTSSCDDDHRTRELVADFRPRTRLGQPVLDIVLGMQGHKLASMPTTTMALATATYLCRRGVRRATADDDGDDDAVPAVPARRVRTGSPCGSRASACRRTHAR